VRAILDGCAQAGMRVALARDVVQLRTVHPAPPLKARDISKYVGLEVSRLFRKNGVPLVTSGALVAVTKKDRALWAAATSEPLVRAILDGCAQAGMRVDAVAPAAETLPAALAIPEGTTEVTLPNGTTTEILSVGAGGVWKSRWSRGLGAPTGSWVAGLAASNGHAADVAPAYAAGIRLPTLSLLPEGHRAAQSKMDRRRVGLGVGAGALLWLLAVGTYVGRLSLTYARATTLLHAFQASADSGLSVRRNLDEGRATLATIGAAHVTRSHTLRLLGDLTKALSDSVTLVAIDVGADGVVRLTGFAPRAPLALAQVGRVPELSNAALDGQVTRETVAGVGDRDRFTVVARVVRR